MSGSERTENLDMTLYGDDPNLDIFDPADLNRNFNILDATYATLNGQITSVAGDVANLTTLFLNLGITTPEDATSLFNDIATAKSNAADAISYFSAMGIHTVSDAQDFLTLLTNVNNIVTSTTTGNAALNSIVRSTTIGNSALNTKYSQLLTSLNALTSGVGTWHQSQDTDASQPNYASVNTDSTIQWAPGGAIRLYRNPTVKIFTGIGLWAMADGTVTVLPSGEHIAQIFPDWVPSNTRSVTRLGFVRAVADASTPGPYLHSMLSATIDTSAVNTGSFISTAGDRSRVSALYISQPCISTQGWGRSYEA